MFEDLKQDSKIGMNCRHLACRSRFGFTLAEVLIVIGIIGVVAALTLPNLNHATGDKEKVTKVKKIYSTLTEAVDRAQAIYAPSDEWYTNLDENADWNEILAKRVTEFMKVSKDCGYNSGCWTNGTNLKYETGDFMEDSGWYGYRILLTDGTALNFYNRGRDVIRVDIDGPNKGAYQYGNDIFDFLLCNDAESINSICPNSLFNSLTSGVVNDSVRSGERPTDFANYATTWVIENGNLDYLKCPDELNWETKTSCE